MVVLRLDIELVLKEWKKRKQRLTLWIEDGLTNMSLNAVLILAILALVTSFVTQNDTTFCRCDW